MVTNVHYNMYLIALCYDDHNNRIAPATVQFILYQLLSKYGSDAEITKLVDSMYDTVTHR
jgi:hypothetical protein